MNVFQSLTCAATLALGLGASGSALAQDADASRSVRFGIKGGANLANVWDNASSLSDNMLKPGFQAGLYLRTRLLPTLYLQPEVLYTTKGSKLGSNDDVYGQRSGTLNLNYIEVPVLLKFAPLPLLSVHAGPYASYLINANISNGQITPLGNSDSPNGQLNVDAFNALDYGAAAGLELNLGLVDVGARYNMGLRQVGRTASARSFTGSGYNQNLSVYVAIGL